MIDSLFALVLGATSLVLLVPCLMLLVESAAAVLWPQSDVVPQPLSETVTVAVLIPAHNEALGMGQTLESLKLQLRPQDRLLVVADNCSDDTAAIARAAGATVVERCNDTLRGKGYALDYGLSQMKADPPEVVVLMDADCDIQPGALGLLVNQALALQRPVQANYLIEQPPTTSLKGFISAFAVKVKNLVRPLGLLRMGAPCLLTGTGIALPWEAAIAVNVASGHITEDMKWGLDLALAGHSPTFLPSARVTSRLPSEGEAAKVQRTRWEHGQLQIMREYLPKLIGQALRQGRVDLLALALELSILPLSLLVMSWAGITALTLGFAWVSQIWLPLYIALAAGVALFGGVILAWYKYGRSDLSLRQLTMIPLYILWKIPLYIAFLLRPEQRWVRTKRDGRIP
jgi:cellulose synthase/poly-beta-1,6-N-acetylglucosamine synthase-like glycosyltransferase